MKLVGSPTSPYVRKVRIVLAEKHIDYDFEVDIPWNADSHVPDYNPLGKVPVLIMDDGATLFDSRVIVEYLDNVSPVSRLIPEPNRHRITVKRWEALADGISDAAATIFLERKRPAAQQSARQPRTRNVPARELDGPRTVTNEAARQRLGDIGNPWVK